MFYFVFISGFFSTTTFALLDLSIAADATHALVILVYSLTIFLYMVLCFDYRRARRLDFIISENYGRVSFEPRFFPVSFLLLLSSAITIFYFQVLVGYNLALAAILGGVEDFTSMRLAAYSGEVATGGGIVNQFRNTIMPISYFSLVALIFSIGHKKFAIAFALFFFPFFVWSVAGAGQRAYLFFSIVALYIFMSSIGRVKPIHIIFAIGLFIIFFGYQSFSLGRTESVDFMVAFAELADRLSGANQIGTVLGFQYIYELPVQYGAEWVEAFSGLIPGVKGSDLAHRVHEHMYGSYRGTAPVAFWVSLYHNFGIFGIPIVLPIILYLFEISRNLLLRPASIFVLMTYSFFILYAALLPISDPVQPFNNGLFGIALALLVYGVRNKAGGLKFSVRGR